MVKESNPTWYVMVKVRTLPFCPVGVVAYPLALCSIPGRGLQDDLSEFSEKCVNLLTFRGSFCSLKLPCNDFTI